MTLKQTVDDRGDTWTLAEYTVSMWVPTDNPDEAQKYLADHLQKLLPSLMQDAPEPYVQ